MLLVTCLACDKPYAEFNISPNGALKLARFPNGTNAHLLDTDKHLQYVIASMPDHPHAESSSKF